MIRIEQISKSYGKIEVLRRISVQFELGQSIAILGPNASGKTTLIKTILGMVKPDGGDIYFDGQDIQQSRLYLKQLGYMPQIGRYPDHMRVGQVIDLMQSLRASIDQPIVDDDLIQEFELEDIYNKPMYTLSGGTRQKLGAALAFLFDPPVLILDEPTASLDPISREVMQEKLIQVKESGKLLIITSHILSELEDIVSHVFYLSEGQQLFFFSIEEIRHLTNEYKLSKAITKMVKQPLNI